MPGSAPPRLAQPYISLEMRFCSRARRSAASAAARRRSSRAASAPPARTAALRARGARGSPWRGIYPRRAAAVEAGPAALAGRTCLVTGATSGLGLATALRLAAMGATVVVHGRDPARCADAAEAVARASASGATVDRLVADLGDLEQVRRLAANSGSATRGSTCSSTTPAQRSRAAR